ncbi:MAG: hypothetical protein CBE14_001935 [Rickettsiales bacterium TMED254]|nr:MAG: hypothetical protein CBE14_001935 [Rickettsiales bacterium TMED254]
MNDVKIKVDYSYYTPTGRRKYNYDYGYGISEMKAINLIKKKIRNRTRLSYNDVTILKLERI